MLASMLNMFRVQDLRKRILFTLFMILLYRIGAFIPSPGSSYCETAPARAACWRSFNSSRAAR